MRIAETRVRDLAQCTVIDDLLDSLHHIRKGLKVAHMHDRPVLAHQLHSPLGVRRTRRKGLLAKHRFTRRNRRFQKR